MAMSILTFGADIAWRAPRLHLGAALASTAALFLLVAANRHRFPASAR